MPLPPIQALGALAAAAPLAEAAITGAADTFATLLKAAASRGGDQPTATGNGNGNGNGLLESPGISNAAGDAKLKAQTESLLRQFHQLLTGLMDDQGIEPGGELQLQAGEAGQIQIAGNTAASPQIQDVIATSPKLNQLFDSIVANANLLRLVEGSTSGLQQPPVTVVVDAEQATLA